MQNHMKVPLKDIRFSKVVDLRSSGCRKIEEWWLVNLLRVNSFGRFEDSSRFE